MEPRKSRPDILLIEDDPHIAEFLADLLHLEGYAVAARANGSALDEVFAAPPRLIFLDLMMPEPNGAEVCRRLRADWRTQAVPIVIMTAAAPALSAQWLRGCVYNELIRKPFDIDEILAVAARYVRDSAAFSADDVAANGSAW